MDTPVDSPCIQVCALDRDDVCLGCGRSLAEIAAWSAADNQQRRAILTRASQRREQLSASRKHPGAG